tara:strand:+ start:68 stop:481 length:414 start_codon:yes stop_codon:yes gene_type:complete
MKNLLLFTVLVTLPLLLGGCWEKSVNVEELEEREYISYLKGSDTPYTGKAFTIYNNGKMETNFKDGKEHGLKTMLYKNGQKGLWAHFKDGKPDGLALQWHENGQKQGEAYFKDGVQISVKFWNSKCETVDTLRESGK